MNAEAARFCPRCGTRLHAAFVGKICPRCALEGAGSWEDPETRYTAIVRGVNDTTGIAVVEIYALP